MKVQNRFFLVLYMILFYLLVISVTPILADENTPVSMDFKGADLRDVFRTLAQIADVNVITHQSVLGEVTLTLNEVPFIEAIDLITMINDLDYRWVGKTLVVASLGKLEDNFKKQRMETFKIQYAQLDNLKEILENLIVDGTVLIDQRTKRLMVTANEEALAKACTVVNNLDVPIPQIFLDVRVEEISTSGLDQSGVPQGVNAKIKLIADAKGLITDVGLELPGVIDILEQEGLSKTLANPGLITLDGESATLLIGDKVPVEALEEVDGEMKSVITYIDAGIQLDFTPRISDDGYITLKVKPQVSSLGEYLTKGYPLIRSREVETVVRIYDGETFVIGGLIRDEDRTNIEKVPFLGDIPILGALFRHDENTKSSTEVVIFITPKIIYPDESTNQDWHWNNRSTSDQLIVPELAKDEVMNDEVEFSGDDVKPIDESSNSLLDNATYQELKGSTIDD